jgi:hypothetical protein
MWVVLEFVGRKQEGANGETQYVLRRKPIK